MPDENLNEYDDMPTQEIQALDYEAMDLDELEQVNYALQRRKAIIQDEQRRLTAAQDPKLHAAAEARRLEVAADPDAPEPQVIGSPGPGVPS